MEPKPLCPPPINTVRLKAFRQRLNKVIMTITDSGYVSMEMMTHLTNQMDGPEVAKELFHISPDGMQVEVYQGAEGVPSIDGCPMPCQPYKVYTYPNLPAKQWKKYQHAHKFVEVVKSRTTKVFLVTDKAKCKLMENSPCADFQACFSDGVTILLSKSKVTITDKDGGSLTVDSESVASRVSPDTIKMVEYAKQCHDQCLHIESSLSAVQSKGQKQDLFPITVGTSSSPFQLPYQPNSSPWTAIQASNQSSMNSCEMLNAGTQPPFSHLPHCNNEIPNASYKQPVMSAELLAHIHSAQNVALSEDEANPFDLNQWNRHSSNERVTIPEGFNCDYNCQQVSENNDAICSSAEVRDLLLSKNVQFVDFGGSSCGSSIKSLSATNTPKKLDHRASCTVPVNNQGNSQNYSYTTMDIPVQASYLCDQHETVEVEQMLQRHRLSDPGLDLATKIQPVDDKYPFPSMKQLPESQTDERQVPFYPMCQMNTYDSSYTQIQDANEHKSVETDLHDFRTGFTTPKKTRPHLQPHLQCYSVDSMKHRHAEKLHRHNLSLGALVDESELKNVRKNLFCDTTLEEPLVSPLPISGPHTLNQDLLAIQHNPSLELSDCSDNEDVSELFTNMRQQSSQRPNESSLPLVKDSLLQLNQQNLLVSVNESTLQASFASPLKARTINNADLSEHFPNQQGINSQASNNSTNSETSTPVSPQKLRPTPQISSESPRKPALIRKVACLSPLKQVNTKVDEALCQHSPMLEQAVRLNNDFSSRMQVVSPQKSKGNISNTNGNISSCNSTASLNTNKKNTKSHVNPANSKSDPGTYKRIALSSNSPLSPQKEFLMPPATGDRSGLDLTLPPHVRNSLDMSLSSYYSDSPSSSPSSGCDPIRQVFVPYTGWASFYATGAVWILYNDGTQLGVKSTEAAMIYIDQDGSQTRYKNTDVVPEIVKMKLEKLPMVIELLMKSPPNTNSGVPAGAE